MIQIKSPAFEDGSRVPVQHTGEAADISPALQWSGIPAAAKQLALICEDPDAPRPEPFVHWVIYGIAPDVKGLPESVKRDATLSEPAGALQGVNSFEKTGYNGPMPPKGHGTHHYHFRLFALDKKFDLPAGLDKQKLLAAIHHNVIEEADFVGTYSRE